MKLCRFQLGDNSARVGLVTGEQTIDDLTAAGVSSLASLLESEKPGAIVEELRTHALPQFTLDQVTLLAPIDRQEVWAAGVTYLRSKKARMDESDFSATAYDRVYEAPRPELFFKALPEKVVPPNAPVGIRKDARWNVPEPELALVITSKGKVVGCTIGNDMSSRDIEGENLLYLPQAKIYHRSCAVGPFVTITPSEAEARTWQITLEIQRGG